jgi:hypothetical protein
MPLLRSSCGYEYSGAPDIALSGRSAPERIRNPSGKLIRSDAQTALVFPPIRIHHLESIALCGRLSQVRKAPRALPTCHETARWNAGSQI